MPNDFRRGSFGFADRFHTRVNYNNMRYDDRFENYIKSLHAEKEKSRENDRQTFHYLKKKIDGKIIKWNEDKEFSKQSCFNFRYMSEERAAEQADWIYKKLRPEVFGLITGRGNGSPGGPAIKQRLERMFSNNLNTGERKYTDRYNCQVSVTRENEGILILKCKRDEKLPMKKPVEKKSSNRYRPSHHEAKNDNEFYKDTYY